VTPNSPVAKAFSSVSPEALLMLTMLVVSDPFEGFWKSELYPPISEASVCRK
jgi:hypothetical protein